MSAVPIATLVVFLVLVQPTLYILWKHGRRGFLGWFYVQFFCVVRIVGSILQIIQEKNSSMSTLTVLIIGNIGLSPLLLAMAGVLHEARRARNAKLNSKLEWFFVIQYHFAVSIAMVIVIIGIIRVDKAQDVKQDSVYLKGGMGLLMLCWVILLAWALVSLRLPKYREVAVFPGGTKLLYAVILSVGFAVLRLAYAVLSFFIEDPAFATSTAAKVALSVVPEMVVITVLVTVGIKTSNMWKSKAKLPEFGNM